MPSEYLPLFVVVAPEDTTVGGAGAARARWEGPGAGAGSAAGVDDSTSRACEVSSPSSGSETPSVPANRMRTRGRTGIGPPRVGVRPQAAAQ